MLAEPNAEPLPSTRLYHEGEHTADPGPLIAPAERDSAPSWLRASQDYLVLTREYGLRDAVQHTDLARTVVGGCTFCSRQVGRAAAVPQAVLRKTVLHPRRPHWAAIRLPVYASVTDDDDGGGGGSGGGGGGGVGSVAKARARVDAARARVDAARARVGGGGGRATAAAFGGGVVAAVVG